MMLRSLARGPGGRCTGKEDRLMNIRQLKQVYVTCLLFKGTAKVNVLDRKDFAGGVVADIEDSMRFIERNTRLAYKIERLRREEIPEYPPAALREAITNATMHRDWFNEGSNVFVEIFRDRIEVSNPGGLPTGMLPSDLGHKSVRRNPLIADLLHRIEYIEKAGTGILRMREAVEKHGSPPPVFESTGFFTATFWPLRTAEVTAEVTGQVIGQVTGHVEGEAGPPQEVTGEAAGEAAGEATGEVVRLLRALQTGPLSRSEAQSALNLSGEANFRVRYLEPSLRLGFVGMTIPDKPSSPNQRYRIKPLGLEVLKKATEAS